MPVTSPGRSVLPYGWHIIKMMGAKPSRLVEMQNDLKGRVQKKIPAPGLSKSSADQPRQIQEYAFGRIHKTRDGFNKVVDSTPDPKGKWTIAPPL